MYSIKNFMLAAALLVGGAGAGYFLLGASGGGLAPMSSLLSFGFIGFGLGLAAYAAQLATRPKLATKKLFAYMAFSLVLSLLGFVLEYRKDVVLEERAKRFELEAAVANLQRDLASERENAGRLRTRGWIWRARAVAGEAYRCEVDGQPVVAVTLPPDSCRNMSILGIGSLCAQGMDNLRAAYCAVTYARHVVDLPPLGSAR
jgi:hypothetical protein